MARSQKLHERAAWIAALAVCLAAAGWAQGGEAPAMSAEEAAAMAAFERAATPGEAHAWLASLAGEWEFHGNFWMAPGTEATHSMGTAVREAILGGRVVREVVISEMFGQAFEGIGHTGFDNVTGQFWSTWFDNMSTSLMMSTGACDGGVCTFEGTNTDPMTGKAAKARMVSQHEGNREIHEMWGPGPDGADFKMMELTYTRKE
ncbi:MAG TPA: DUF1579 family protein [Thermoanaerobaculia bacterium]|nr:DUF1579 family protein [Thermoanaerobaculia bacterium]